LIASIRILCDLDELAGGAFAQVGLVVIAGGTQRPEQVFALPHHEQSGGPRFHLVSTLELDQRLGVLSGVEQLETRLVVTARLVRA
jgi:hypothetical protein